MKKTSLLMEIKSCVHFIYFTQITLLLLLTFVIPMDFWPELLESYTIKIQAICVLISYLFLRKVENSLMKIAKNT